MSENALKKKEVEVWSLRVRTKRGGWKEVNGEEEKKCQKGNGTIFEALYQI